MFETVFVPGTVEAVAYQDGEELGRFVLRSPAEDWELSLNSDSEGKELIYLSAVLRDKNNVTVTSADEWLTASVDGADLLGFGTGDPKPQNNYNEGRARTFMGRAQLVLKKTGSGPITVSISSETGKTAQISL